MQKFSQPLCCCPCPSAPLTLAAVTLGWDRTEETAQMRASACLKQMVVYERTILLPFRLVRYATRGTISETGLPERANPSQSGLIKSGLIQNVNTQLTLNGW